MAEQNFWIVHSGESPGVLWYLLFCRCLIFDLLPIYHPLLMKLFMYFQVSLFQSDLRDLHVDFFGFFFLQRVLLLFRLIFYREAIFT